MNAFFAKLAAAAAITAALGACKAPSEEPAESAQANGIPVGQIRGTAAVNAVLRARLLDDDDPKSASFEVERLAGSEIHGLRGLLGQHAATGSHVTYRGGEPNPFGVLLWQQVLGRFAEGLAATCDTPGVATATFFDGTRVTLGPTFAPKLAAACTFAGDEATRREISRALFRAVAGYGAADEEAAFVEAFAKDGSPFTEATPKERVAAMIQAIVLNPHFLLVK